MTSGPPVIDEDRAARAEHGEFRRAIGLRSAVAINMTQMCGIGPFVTIPLMVGAMGGPQAIFAWLLGAVLAMADGLVWAELGAAMPGAGGTYLYLREAFQYRTGRLMPFLFVWTIILAIPLIMSTGVIGIVQYLGYYFPSLTDTAGQNGQFFHDLLLPAHLKVTAISLGVVALVIVTLYRGIAAVGMMANVLFVVMLLTVGGTIAACLTHFDRHLAFTFPVGSFAWGGAFWLGLGQGLIYAIYDYMGYNTTACIGEEIRDPGRVMPKSIIYSVLGIMVIYLVMNVGVMGVVPWRDVADSKSIGSLVIERTWGSGAALVFTGLVIVTGFGSLVAGLLGASRIPYNAAKDRLFFQVFARMHPRFHFPHIGLLVMGVVTAIASFFPLDQVINMLLAAIVLIQGVAQVIALFVLRRRQPGLRRPYRMTMYPVPAVVALAGWGFAYYWSGWPVILLSLGWLGLGVAAFFVWAWFERTWPFGQIEVCEAFLDRDATSPRRGFEVPPPGGGEGDGRLG
jgi:amino acid transporter